MYNLGRNLIVRSYELHLNPSFPIPLSTRMKNMMPCLFGELGVDINDLLHFIVTAKEDTRPVVNVLWDDLQHALHLAVDGLTTR